MKSSLLLLLLVTLTLAARTAAGHVVKRSDDTNPLDAIVSKLSQDVTALSARLTALENSAGSKAAFLGQLRGGSGGKISIAAQSAIHFTEIFDIGDNFDPVTGVYTVRYPGVYVINFLLLSTDAILFLADLKMNGNLLVRCRQDKANSCSAGLSVQARSGDKFWVEVNVGGPFWGDHHSFFSTTLAIPLP